MDSYGFLLFLILFLLLMLLIARAILKWLVRFVVTQAILTKKELDKKDNDTK